MPDRFQVTKTDEETVLDYIQDESASGKLLGEIHDDLQGSYISHSKLFYIFKIRQRYVCKYLLSDKKLYNFWPST